MDRQVAAASALAAARELLEENEWMIFGVWDNPRCPWCKGRQRYGGHKPKCKQQRALHLIAEATKED